MLEVTFGLAEIDDRFHIWRVPVLRYGDKIGETVIDAFSEKLIQKKFR